jgi:hypothetical protein
MCWGMWEYVLVVLVVPGEIQQRVLAKLPE